MAVKTQDSPKAGRGPPKADSVYNLIVEWHIAHTIIASFLAMLGFFMDWQNLMGGIRVIKKGKGPQPILIFPAILYVLAAFASDGAMSFKLAAIGVGIAFHLIATLGLRFIGGHRAR